MGGRGGGASGGAYRPAGRAGSQGRDCQNRCRAHARRKLIAPSDMDCRVAYLMKVIGRLYCTDHLGDPKELSPEQRCSLRKQRSSPVLEKLKRWLVLTHQKRTGELGTCQGHGLYPQPAGRLDPFCEGWTRESGQQRSCEQQLRAIALGRRNYLFGGSHRAASRAAVLHSLTRSCAQNDVPPLSYFADTLRKIVDGWPQSRIEELLPESLGADPCRPVATGGSALAKNRAYRPPCTTSHHRTPTHIPRRDDLVGGNE